MTNGLRYDRERVLNMWAGGLTREQIARTLGMSPAGQHIASIVRQARQAGDQRAVKRPPGARR